MRRKIQLLLLLFLIAGTTESGVRASTDCERWIAAYKAELAHTKAVRRMQAAQARAKRAVKRKLANYVKKPSPPKPVQVHYFRPRYTRQQILDRFNLLCGDLPGGDLPKQDVMEAKAGPLDRLSDMEKFVPVETASTFGEDGLLPPIEGPPYTSPTGPGGGGGGGGSSIPPIFGGGGGGTTPTDSTPGGGTNPPGGGGGDIPPPVGVVPEPDSLVLLATGLAAAAGVVRRRYRG
jgi:hypothetical protein